MASAATVAEHLAELPPDRRQAISVVRDVLSAAKKPDPAAKKAAVR